MTKMSSRKIQIYKNIDWPIVLCYLLLLLIGFMNIYSADYKLESVVSSGLSKADSQLMWIGIASLVALAVLAIDVKLYQFFSYYIYVLFVVLLVVTIIFAEDINGSRSWLKLGSLRIQFAEFAKFATALALAKCMSYYDFTLKQSRYVWQVLLILFLPVALIIMQREMGSALVFFSLFLVLYREGLPNIVMLLGLLFIVLFVLVLRFGDVQIAETLGSWGLFSALMLVLLIGAVVILLNGLKKVILRYVLGGVFAIFLLVYSLNRWISLEVRYTDVVLVISLLIGLLCIVYGFFRQNKVLMFTALFLWGMSLYCCSVDYIFDNVLELHQQNRVKVLLGLEDDPTGVGYNVNQSKIAIGSGGFLGKGFLEGTQTKLNYVPEQVTDFIFCNIGEEFGFLGSVSLLLLYMFFLFRLVKMAERQHDAFGRIYGYCVASIFLFHLLINVGMVIGLMPVIGIPLPFVSYGGSSLVAFTILLFIFIKMDASRSEQFH